MIRLFPILSMMVCCCGGCFGPAPAGEFVGQAQRLHDGALASAITANADLRDYVQLIGKRIIASARAAEPGKAHDELFEQMQFHLVVCDVPNVFTTGGPHVYLYSGLFGQCRSEDELAAAMAHAYAHALDLDAERIGIQPDPGLPLARVGWEFVIHRFTLAQEQSADRLAFELYAQAGYDPQKFAALFDRLAAVPGGISPDRMALATRAQQARQWAASAPKTRRPLPVADPRTFDLLRRQAASLNPQLVNHDAQLLLRAFPNCMLAGDTPDQQAAQQQLQPPTPPPTRLEPS